MRKHLKVSYMVRVVLVSPLRRRLEEPRVQHCLQLLAVAPLHLVEEGAGGVNPLGPGGR